MIYARSPYIVHLNDSGLVRAQFKLYIYTGTKDTDKGTADYEFDMTAIGGTITFDIAPYIRDFLRNRFVTPISAERFVWVTTEVAKDTGAGLGSFATWEATQLACDGYSEPMQGKNYTTAPLQTEIIQTTYGSSGSQLGKIVKASGETMRIAYRATDINILGSTYEVQVFPQLNLGGTEITSFSINDLQAQTETDSQIIYMRLPVNAKSFGLGTTAQAATSYYNIHELVGECGSLRRIFFINKFGVKQELHFVGRTVESYSTDSDEYKRNILSGGTYSTWDRQKVVYNKTAKKTVTVNSGYYPQEYNEVFKQLLMSEQVWINVDGEDGSSTDEYEAVTIVNSDFTYKYSKYDKVINYELTLEYANDAINNIL